MSRRLRRTLRRGAFGAVVVLAPFCVAGFALGQTSGLAFDPYRPYDGGFEAGANPPGAAYNFAAINASRSRTFASPSNESGFMYEDLFGSGLNGSDESGTRRAPSNAPYWYANRQYDRQLNRLPAPNPADQKYYQDQQKRTQDYFAALHERDPKKRAALLYALEQDTLRASRDLRVQPKPGVRTGTTPAGANPGRPAAGAPGTAPNAGAPRAAVMPATGLSTPAARATVVPPAAGVSTPAIRAGAASPATGGVPTPAAAARARTAPPNVALPRTRTETPSEIVERALATEPPTTPATTTPRANPLTTRRRNPYLPAQPPR